MSKMKTRSPRPLLSCALLILVLAFCPEIGFSQGNLYGGPAECSEEVYEPFRGKIIRDIKVIIRDVFDRGDLSTLYQTANDLKMSTKEFVVRRELLFSAGDPLDPFVVAETERLLRNISFLRSIEIIPELDGEFVDITVSVQDVWTLIPQFSYSSGDGQEQQTIGLVESNLGGLAQRLGLLYEKDEDREAIEAVWSHRRFLDSPNQFTVGLFDRDDGERLLAYYGNPFRSVLQRESWALSSEVADTIGRLFEGGSERYIYRRDSGDFQAQYTIARGNLETSPYRLSFGYRYQDEQFSEADEGDFDALNIDPTTVSRDPALLAEDRRFSGPLFSFSYLEPNFITRRYIDRFERPSDYNLGPSFSATTFLAPDVFGSRDDALVLSATANRGLEVCDRSFFRYEFGVASRFQEDEFRNSLFRGEAKYYRMMGPLFLGDVYLGSHTLAGNIFFDYGSRLDLDREFLLGGNNALRGYEAKTFTGDKRMALNIEDRIHIAEDVWQLVSFGAAVFLDAGGTTSSDFGEIVSHELHSNIGFGLRLAFPRSSSGRVFRIDVAFPLRDGPDGSGDFEPRILFSGGQLFSSFLRSESLGAERANVSVGFDR